MRLGHRVVLHARNPGRARQAMEQVPGAETVLPADLADPSEVKKLALEANAIGPFDAVIHNAGVYRTTGKTLFHVNVLAPYMLTCLMALPERLIYLSSGMHASGRPLKGPPDLGRLTYSDTKLQLTTLMKAVARYFPQVYSNAVDPGWVPTKMGGAAAPDDLREGYLTQCWLAVSSEEKALVSGGYFYHHRQQPPNPVVNETTSQELLLKVCGELTGVSFPGDSHNF